MIYRTYVGADHPPEDEWPDDDPPPDGRPALERLTAALDALRQMPRLTTDPVGRKDRDADYRERQ